MRIELLSCNCGLVNSQVCLSIHYWVVGKFPLSYTIQECIEVYCDLIGWKLLTLTKEGHRVSYSLSVEVGEHEDINQTILENHYDFIDLKGIA